MGVGSCTSKTFLILISLIFLAAAAALAYVGINAIVTYKQYENVVGNMYVMLPAVIILCVAVFMLIIGCLGFCSTIQESCCGLGCFITLISIILVAGVASLVLGLVYKDKTQNKQADQESLSDFFMSMTQRIEDTRSEGWPKKLAFSEGNIGNDALYFLGKGFL